MRRLAFVSAFLVAIHGLIAAETKLAPPPLPAPPSPIVSFRQLLNMNSAARATELQKKSPRNRAIIEDRLKEFDALSKEQREVRLKLMELRWQLMSLIHQTPNNRAAALNLIAEQDRAGINERLRYWDQLPPDVQKAVLENEMMLSYIISGQAANTTELTNRVETLPSNLRSNLLATMERWRKMTPDQQKQIFDNFRSVFDLNEGERQKVISQSPIDRSSATEQEKIARLMKSFDELPPAQRQRWMNSLQKFTSMSMEERAQFVQNAERWQKMSETERQNWRNLIRKIPPLPPMPPGARFGPVEKLSSASATN